MKVKQIFLPKERLLEGACSLLGVGEEHVERALAYLKENKEVVSVKYEGRECLYLKEYYDAEKYIADKLDLLDSLTVLTAADLKGKRLIDVGCGAGFPGAPLAIACPEAMRSPYGVPMILPVQNCMQQEMSEAIAMPRRQPKPAPLWTMHLKVTAIASARETAQI